MRKLFGLFLIIFGLCSGCFTWISGLTTDQTDATPLFIHIGVSVGLIILGLLLTWSYER